MKATIIQTIEDGKPRFHICEIDGYDVNCPDSMSDLMTLNTIFSRHSEQIKRETTEALAERERLFAQIGQSLDALEQKDEPTEVEEDEKCDSRAINTECGWLDFPIRTGIFNPRTGKEYILSDYYVDANGNRHFTHQEALEIWERTPEWGPCTDEFHKALADELWDDDEDEWRENVCGTLLNGFEYATKVLKYELEGYRYPSTGVLTGVGYHGYSWASSVSGTNAMYLYFSGGSLGPSSAHYRGYGFQVRCLQEL